MTKPSNFILSSDYTTVKNDSNGSATVTVPASVVIAGNGYTTYTADINIGTKGSFARGRIKSSLDTDYYVANNVDYIRTGINGGSPATYDLNVYFWRPSTSILRCQVLIQNPYGTALTTSSTSETLSFYANSILPPF
jgi:hypothetical protein